MRSAFIVAVALAGCAPQMMWVRPDTSRADFDRDVARCEYEAASSTATYGSGQNTVRSNSGSFAQGLGIGIGRSVEKSNLMFLCMKARGYTQRPHDPAAIAAVNASPNTVVSRPAP